MTIPQDPQTPQPHPHQAAGPYPPPQAMPSPHPVYAPAPRKSRGLLIALLVMLTIAGIGIFGMLLLFALIQSQVGNVGGKQFVETTVESGGPDKIAIISVSGLLLGSGSHADGSGIIPGLCRKLRYAAKDKSVKAVLLQIDSGGGGLTTSEIVRHEIKRLKEKGKPVVALIGDMAASGGYYIIAPADHIIAQPTSMIGSFGVIIPHYQAKDLLENKLGIRAEPIKSVEYKDLLSMARDMKPRETEAIQALVDHYHQQFVDIIAEGRPLTAEEVKPLANGLIYTAEQSMEYKLIDQIGYYDDAIAKAKTLGQAPNATVVAYRDPQLFGGLFQAHAQSARMRAIQACMEEFVLEGSPRIMAHWRGPGGLQR